MSSRSRKQVLDDIDRLLREHCNACEKRIRGGNNARSKKKHEVFHSAVDVYCSTQCEIGQGLKNLGKKLNEISSTERKTRPKRPGMKVKIHKTS